MQLDFGGVLVQSLRGCFVHAFSFIRFVALESGKEEAQKEAYRG